MASTIDHVEKTLADSYRKEIDQEENVWRSLPFFAATIAFQFTTLAQVVLRLPAHGSGAWWDAILAIALQSVCVAVALGFLAASIVPARFTYVSEEPALLDYARGLDQDAQDAIDVGQPPIDPLVELKRTLADQYALATHHNRQINQTRAYRRSVAGLAILTSIGFTGFLIVRMLLYNLPR